MITIKDIAKMANVSRSTVSRVLNNSGYVSVAARQRVEKVIKDTGYQPSEQAKSLRTKKTKVIGVILPTIQTETPSKTVTGLGRELSKHNYQILLANTDLDKQKELEYLDLLRIRQVDGIVLIATNMDVELVKKVKEIDIPIVVVGQDLDGVMRVIYDDYGAARAMMKHLIEIGHKRIGFIGVSEEDHAVGYLRKKAYYDVMHEFDLKREESWVQEAIFDIDSGYSAVQQIWTQAKEKPTAIFAVTDRLAIGAMSYLKEHNYQIPEEVGIVGIGDSELSQYVDPTLTTMDYCNEHAGEEAAKQILANLRKEDYQEKIVLDYRLIDRDSV